MWPLLLDMTKEESVQSLRNLELEAYSSLVTALRAQGALNQEKRRLLKETGLALNISNDRHKAEIRRAISDERLNTIAYYVTGNEGTIEDWAHEGRRIVPLLPRVPPQTPYSAIAEEAAEITSHNNKQLPLPIYTDRKRSSAPQAVSTVTESGTSKSPTFRVPDLPREDVKKRKSPFNSENTTLSTHLIGPKLSRISQIYRLQSHLDENYLQTENLSEADTACGSLTETQVTNTKAINVKPNTSVMVKPPSQSQGGPSGEQHKAVIVCPPKKSGYKSQKLVVVSNTQTLPTNSILQKTLSVPMNKITKLNLEKFKIVSNTTIPSTVQVSVSAQNPLQKHKVVTLKANSDKKVIPFSQLQMLNSKGGIKVLPLSGKILGKNVTVTTSTPAYITKNLTSPIVTYSKLQETLTSNNTMTEIKADQEENVKNGNRLAAQDQTKANEGLESQNDDFQIICKGNEFQNKVGTEMVNGGPFDNCSKDTKDYEINMSDKSDLTDLMEVEVSNIELRTSSLEEVYSDVKTDIVSSENTSGDNVVSN